jgi:hypothetical protein
VVAKGIGDVMAILIGIPTYDDTVKAGLTQAIMQEGQTPGCPPYTVAFKASSLLAFAHNSLLCTALNNRSQISHLLINHADVVPDPGYLKTLYDEMLMTGAGVVSVLMPLKDRKGLTSTALLPDYARADWAIRPRTYTRQRVTMSEAMTLPETFGAAEVAQVFGKPAEGAALLVNTGLMLIDVQQPWAEQAHFEINDAIDRNADGKFIADVEPEDWNFSRQLAVLGVKVVCTRKVKAIHVGRANFPNDAAWGEWQHDQNGGLG